METLPTAIEMGLLTVKLRGTAPNREAVIKGHVDYQLWFETPSRSGTVVTIGDGVYQFGRTLQNSEL